MPATRTIRSSSARISHIVSRRAVALWIASLALSACASGDKPPAVRAPGATAGTATHTTAPREPGGTQADADHPHPRFDVRERRGSRPVPPAPSAVEQMDVPFAGRVRVAAKTSVATAATIEEFATLEDLLDSMPSDDLMVKRQIAADAPRLPEETRNVKVRRVWIYAARLDDDQDVRLILGTDPRASARFHLVAIATALPPPGAPARDALRAVREDVFEALGHRMPGWSYGILDPPALVEITGSLLYDVEHSPGATAPPRLRPATGWEIHPITLLRELD
jgi:hypothetical protein